jgi:hypothetical protein
LRLAVGAGNWLGLSVVESLDRIESAGYVPGIDPVSPRNSGTIIRVFLIEGWILARLRKETCLTVCSQPLKDVAALILEMGMRPEEFYRMKGSNVFLERGYLFNPNGQTKSAK